MPGHQRNGPLDVQHNGPPVTVTYGEVVDRDTIHRIKELSLTEIATLTLTGTMDAHRKLESFSRYLEIYRDQRKRLFEGWADGSISFDLTASFVDVRVYRGNLA